MIDEPQDFHEALAAMVIHHVMTNNLLSADCRPARNARGEEGCELMLVVSSGAVEQLGAFLAECIEEA